MAGRVESVQRFFLAPQHHYHFERFITYVDGLDKTLKFLEPVFDSMRVIAERMHASENTVEGFSDAYEAIKTSRDVIGMFNALGGVARSIVACAIRIVWLAKGIIQQKDVILVPKHEKDVDGAVYERQTIDEDYLNPNKKIRIVTDREGNKQTLIPQLRTLTVVDEHGQKHTFQTPFEVKIHPMQKHNEVAVGLWEKSTKLASEIFVMLSGGCYTAAFAIFRPIANSAKHGHVPLSPTAKKLAGYFPDAMMYNHIFSICGSVCEIAYQNAAYQRAMEDPNADPVMIRKEFEKKVWGSGVGLFVKSVELVQDVFKKVAPATPPEIKLPLGIIIGLGSVYQVWLKTATPGQ